MQPQEIKTRREALDLSQKQLADAFGVHVRTVSAWEQGKQRAPEYVELALCELARRRQEQAK